MAAKLAEGAQAPTPGFAADSEARRDFRAEERKPRGKRRWMAVAALVILLGAGGVTWWWSSRAHGGATYSTVRATQGPVVKTISATGTVNPVLTIMVGTYVSGVIQNITCDYNTQVKKDQLCAQIDPRPYQTVVDQDEANVSTAKAQLAKDRASLGYAKVTFDRATSLIAGGVISQDAFDSAKSTLNQLEAQVGLDEATIAQREAELHMAEVNLGYTNITSPVDGTVVSRNVTMGQTVAASFQTPTLFLIATDLKKMQVDTNVSEGDMRNLKSGDRASFSVATFPNQIFMGEVAQVRQSPQSVQNVVTYDVVVSVDNGDLALKPGMTATVRIITDERSNVLRVPDQAFRYAPGGMSRSTYQPAALGNQSHEGSLWVLRDGKPMRVDVKLGLDDDSHTQILGGALKAGDEVVVSEESGGKQRGALTMPSLRRP